VELKAIGFSKIQSTIHSECEEENEDSIIGGKN